MLRQLMRVRDKQRAPVSLVVAVTPAADVVRRRNELVRTWTLGSSNCKPIANADLGSGLAIGRSSSGNGLAHLSTSQAALRKAIL